MPATLDQLQIKELVRCIETTDIAGARAAAKRHVTNAMNSAFSAQDEGATA
jgi:hypothetical protein